MHKRFSLLPVLAVSLFLMSGMCKKEGDSDTIPGPGGGGPDVLLHNDGYLCILGQDLNGHTDTLTYHFTTSGRELTVFARQFLLDNNKIRFTNNSNGTRTIEKVIPHLYQNKSYQWFGIDQNVSPDFSSFPNNKYLFDFYHDKESELTQFIIKRKEGDVNKFTIESKAYPGYYLGCAKWKHATHAIEDRMVFTTTPKEWWFEQK